LTERISERPGARLQVQGTAAGEEKSGRHMRLSRSTSTRTSPAALARQLATPYLDALRAYAARDPHRFHVPGHQAGTEVDPGLADALGEAVLALDVPALTAGVDAGPAPTPLAEARALAAEAWGAERTWFLLNGASQGNHAACLAVAHAGSRVVVQRNAHTSTIDGVILAGLRPTFLGPELDHGLGIVWCPTPDQLDRALRNTPDAAGAFVVSPTYEGACADIAGLAEVAHRHGVPLIVDEAWGTHLAFSDRLPDHALAAGADLVISSPHKILGSLTQSALMHLGRTPHPSLPASVVERAVTLTTSTSPNAFLLASLDAARRFASASFAELLDHTIDALRGVREAIRTLPGVDVLDERIVGKPGVAGHDPMRLAIDVRGTGLSGLDLAQSMRDHADLHVEYASPPLIVALPGIGPRASERGEALRAALEEAIDLVGRSPRDAHNPIVPPPPWMPLEVAPREAYFGPQERVPAERAAGRIAAETLATYPRGSRWSCPASASPAT
jgi:arginine decarboxylase